MASAPEAKSDDDSIEPGKSMYFVFDIPLALSQGLVSSMQNTAAKIGTVTLPGDKTQERV